MIHFEVHAQEGAFAGPVAILVDNASASTSEILTAGLQETKRAMVFGETTAGAALPSAITLLPTADLLQFVVADVRTPSGVMLEGRGVIPDRTIRRTVQDLAAERDPVIEAAIGWLDSEKLRSRSP